MPTKYNITQRKITYKIKDARFRINYYKKRILERPENIECYLYKIEQINQLIKQYYEELQQTKSYSSRGKK